MRTTYTFCGFAALLALCLVGCSPDDQSSAAPTAAVEMTMVSGVEGKPAAAIAKECLGCHAQAVSLSDIPAKEMPDAIRAVMAGEVGHPTTLPKLTDEQVVELAKLLQPS